MVVTRGRCHVIKLHAVVMNISFLIAANKFKTSMLLSANIT